MNIRFYSPKAKPTSPRSNPTSPRIQANPPETPSSRRRTFQSRPSRLSNVYTPAIETPATAQASRRTRRTAALETPKNEQSEASDLEIPDSIESTGWTFDQYVGSFEAAGTPDGPSSPTSASDMRTSRVRKPTRRAIESLETSKKTPRRKNTSGPTSSTEKPDTRGAKVAKNNVAKKPIKKTRTSRRMANSNLRKNVLLIGHDIDVKAAGKALFDLTVEALSPGFTLSSDSLAIYEKAQNEYYQRQENEKYGTDLPADQSNTSGDVEMIDQDLSAIPEIALPPALPNVPATNQVGILGYERLSDPKIDSDGWVETGLVNNMGEAVFVISDDYHPHFPTNSYGHEGLPWPPVRARSNKQAAADSAHGFPPFLGSRNVPVDGEAPFVTENVQEEQARLLASAPPAPEKKEKKPRGRKRRQTEAAAAVAKTETETAEAAQINGDEATTALGGRKSQRRRRQTAPALAAASPKSSPSKPSPSKPSPSKPSPPKHSKPSPSKPSKTPPSKPSPSSLAPTAKKVQSRLAATVTAGTDGDKPKVQRLRLTLKPVKTETPGRASVSTEAPALQSPSSPAPLRTPSSAGTSKRRRRGK